ncbi:hypothetical protein [Luethyella okanaganae]|uniref:Uncharacterized protein n=1 Tax=Luethyella okanaganae TaxID=69372 RepID=A0ABW1VGL3_9MICO
MGGQSNDVESPEAAFAPSVEDQRLASGTVSAVRARWSGMIRLVGVGSLLVAVLIGAIAYGHLLRSGREDEHLLTLIVGEWFPTLFEIAITAIAIGITAIICGAIVSPPNPTRRGRRSRIAFASVLVALVAISLPATAIVSGFQLLNRASYTVLPGQSDGGCRIVVSEWSFLLAGGGSAGIVQPGSVMVQWTRDYTADDGQTPFSRGRYTLEWHDRTADLVLHGDGTDPVWWTTDGPLVCEQ